MPSEERNVVYSSFIIIIIEKKKERKKERTKKENRRAAKWPDGNDPIVPQTATLHVPSPYHRAALVERRKRLVIKKKGSGIGK